MTLPVDSFQAVRPAVARASAQTDPDALRQEAEQGDAGAQIELGVMYSSGQDVPEDAAEAVRWFRLAAEQGNAIAQANLGLMYASGRGVPEDVAPLRPPLPRGLRP